MAYNDGTVGIAEDDLCAHVDELVNEEQTALKHLLMEKHAASSLGGHDDEYRQKVGRQSRPRGIGQRHDCTVDERLYLVVLLTGDIEVVTLSLDFHPQSAEGIRDDAKVIKRHIFDADAVATHGCHTDE